MGGGRQVVEWEGEKGRVIHRGIERHTVGQLHRAVTRDSAGSERSAISWVAGLDLAGESRNLWA